MKCPNCNKEMTYDLPIVLPSYTPGNTTNYYNKYDCTCGVTIEDYLSGQKVTYPGGTIEWISYE